MYDIRVIDKTGIFHVHHDGDKPSARDRARRMAERTYPPERGYKHTWSADCVMVFKDKRHIADVAVEPLDPQAG